MYIAAGLARAVGIFCQEAAMSRVGGNRFGVMEEVREWPSRVTRLSLYHDDKVLVYRCASKLLKPAILEKQFECF